MPKAADTLTTSTSATAPPDARLVALLAQLLRQDEVIEAILDEGHHLPPGITPASEDQEHRLDLACDVRSGIVTEIIETPATTQAGRAAKAQAMLTLLGSDILNADETIEVRLAFALAVDVLAEAQSGTDVEIIRMVDEVMALNAQSRALSEETESLDWVASERFFQERIRSLVERDRELRRALVPIRATTLAGFRAKARVVQEYSNCEAGYATGDEDDAMAWSLANDLLGVPSVMKADDDVESVA